jgi:hypothetical protein
MRVLLLLAVVGCASSGGGTTTQPAPQGPSDQVLLVDASGKVYRRTGDQDRPVEQTAPGTVADGVQAVFAAYGDLGVPAVTAEPATGRVASREFEAPSRIGGRPISSYIDCGSDPMGSPRAASYAVLLTARSNVTAADSGHVTLGTVVRATARQRGVSADPIACESTGALEKRINLQAITHLAK